MMITRRNISIQIKYIYRENEADKALEMIEILAKFEFSRKNIIGIILDGEI